MHPRLSLSSLACAAFLVACSPPPQGPSAPQSETTPPSAEGPKADAPAAEAKKAETPDSPPKSAAPAAKPKSKYTVLGKSLSEIGDLELHEAFEKAGWAKAGEGVGSLTLGEYSSTNFAIEKGKAKGKVRIVRPVAKPEPSGTTKAIPPSELSERLNKDTSAFLHDGEADIFLAVEFDSGAKAADAQKLLDSVIKK